MLMRFTRCEEMAILHKVIRMTEAIFQKEWGVTTSSIHMSLSNGGYPSFPGVRLENEEQTCFAHVFTVQSSYGPQLTVHYALQEQMEIKENFSMSRFSIARYAFRADGVLISYKTEEPKEAAEALYQFFNTKQLPEKQG